MLNLFRVTEIKIFLTLLSQFVQCYLKITAYSKHPTQTETDEVCMTLLFLKGSMLQPL